MKTMANFGVLFVVSAAGMVFGATTDEIIDLAKKGTPEEQILKEIDATPGEFDMGATQVIALREAKASDKVIAAMLRHVSVKAPAKSAVASLPPQPLPPESRDVAQPLPPE